MVVLAGRFPPVVNMLIFMLLFIINAMSLLSDNLQMTWALMVASSSQLLVKAPPTPSHGGGTKVHASTLASAGTSRESRNSRELASRPNAP